eukprot:gb/GECG01003790.1/.p1 GENE.gb/GECG01003790.1/~~gb/GECG01003790.1/.p1  ORF type:complete len:549 (+),score=49.84 gb/GECG01003790.1/:1-1647(+)
MERGAGHPRKRAFSSTISLLEVSDDDGGNTSDSEGQSGFSHGTGSSSDQAESNKCRRKNTASSVKGGRESGGGISSRWNDLPSNVLSRCFSFLYLHDKCSVGTVSKQWRRAYLTPLSWEVVDTKPIEEIEEDRGADGYDVITGSEHAKGMYEHFRAISLRKIAPLLSQTYTLVLRSNSLRYTTEDVQLVASNSTRLKRLVIVGAPDQLLGFDLSCFGWFSGLTSMRVTLCNDASFVDSIIDSNSSTLEELCLENTLIDERRLHGLARCNKLQRIKIAARTSNLDRALQGITKRCNELVSLELKHGARLTDTAFVGDFPQLQALEPGVDGRSEAMRIVQSKGRTSGTAQSRLGMAIERYGPATRQLPLSHINIDKANELTDKGLLCLLVQCREMKCLSIRYAPHVTSKLLKQLPRLCPHLESLTLDFCQSVTDDVISRLCHSSKLRRNLKKFSVMGTSITDRGVKKIGEAFQHLLWLGLSWNPKITDEGLKALSFNQEQLNILEIRGCKNISPMLLRILRDEVGCFDESPSKDNAEISLKFRQHCVVTS